MRKLCAWFLALLLLASLTFALQPHPSTWLSANLTELLPKTHTDAPWLTAVQQQIAGRNERQFIALVGAPQANKARQTAATLCATWQQAKYFSTLNCQQTFDRESLTRNMLALGDYLLPPEQRALLMHAPQQYFLQRAQAIVSPMQASIVPLSEDVLGVTSHFTLPYWGQFALNLQSGWLERRVNQETWVLIHGELRETPSAQALLALKPTAMLLAKAQQSQLIIASPALVSAMAQREGLTEANWMSVVGILGVVLLFASIFARWRLVYLLIPIGLAELAAALICVLIFGQIHLLTLVIGTSLLGLLLDLPLHWLGSAQAQHWQGKATMRALRKPFLASTAITLLGYLMMLFAPLEILQQTAIFSACALAIAVGFYVSTLPDILARFQPRHNKCWQRVMSGVQESLAWLLQQRKSLYGLGILLLIAGGIFLPKMHWQDDIHDWVQLPPSEVQAFSQVGKLTGLLAENAYFVVSAATPEALIERNQALATSLSRLQAAHQLANYQSIAQVARSTAEQNTLQHTWQQLAENPQAAAPLLALGLPQASITSALKQLASRPTLTLSQALANPLFKPWQGLYLGKMDGRYVSMVRLFGMHDKAAVQALAQTDAIRFVQPVARINTAFAHLRRLAFELKLLSYPLAWILLAFLFGKWKALAMLAVPSVAVLLTMTLFSALQLTLSLFVIFGLLLVLAIGVDYGVYAFAHKGATRQKLAGMMLAALTTVFSFGLLSFSSTPVVAAFGLTVAIGVFFSALLAMLATVASHDN